MTFQQKRDAWRKHCTEQIELHGIDIHTLPSGASRLIGLHGDVTVTDIAELSALELAEMTRGRAHR